MLSSLFGPGRPEVDEAKGKGKGKGKAKGLPPPPPAGKGTRKGAAPGKGSSAVPSDAAPNFRCSEPPAHLQAPRNVSRTTIRHSQTYRYMDTAGTLWEDTDPWGQGADSLFPAFSLDIDRLQALWEPPPAAPMGMGARNRERRGKSSAMLPTNVLMRVDITTKGLRLTPDLVRQALDGDFEALSETARQALATDLAPFAEEYLGPLRGWVARFGEDRLSPGEKVLWAIGNTPFGPMKARTLGLSMVLAEELEDLEASVAAPAKLLGNLRSSRPLKMLLQTALAIRNITAQQDWAMFPLPALADAMKVERSRQNLDMPQNLRDSEWYKHHFPTSLRLVAEAVLNMDAEHTRLRASRKSAIAKMTRSEIARRLIWEYADDTGPSILSVFSLLSDCDSGLFDEEVIHNARQLQFALADFRGEQLNPLRQHFEETPLDHRRPVDRDGWISKIDDLNIWVQEAIDSCDHLRREYFSLVKDAIRMVALPVSRDDRHNFEKAQDAIRSLKHLGQNVSQEVDHLRFLRRIGARSERPLVGADGERWRPRTWRPVATAEEILCATNDVDIIRSLRGQATSTDAVPEEPQSDEARRQAKAKAAAKRAEASAKAEEERAAKAATLMHSGIEGTYVRDPVTGKWGPPPRDPDL
mmetsp:Transcript_54314/g.115931  ORF Transcript_54314/g.115931 Transcript_54314/m.115931 type:complete len:641 (+) Transcript_54314:235-2157(+)